MFWKTSNLQRLQRMTKEALDSKLDSWIVASSKGLNSKLHQELDNELEYTIRRATLVGRKLGKLHKWKRAKFSPHLEVYGLSRRVGGVFYIVLRKGKKPS